MSDLNQELKQKIANTLKAREESKKDIDTQGKILKLAEYGLKVHPEDTVLFLEAQAEHAARVQRFVILSDATDAVLKVMETRS